MAGPAATAYVSIRGDSKKLSPDMDKAHAKVKQSMEKIAKVAAVAMTAAVAAVGYAVQRVARESVKLAQVQEDAEKRLEIAMKSRGDYTLRALNELKAYASELQKVTTAGDEATISMMGNLKAYGMSTAEVKLATKATLDLAAAKKIDLVAASELIGKAFVGETGSLSRYGLVLDKNIEKSQKFSAVLKLVEGSFGGAAKGARETFSGAVQSLGNAYGDLQETVGYAITKNEALISLIIELEGYLVGLQPKIKEVADVFADWVKANDDLIKQKVQDTILAIWDGTKKVVNVYNSLPAGVIGAAGTGILGRLLFGSTPAGVFLGTLVLIDAQIQKFKGEGGFIGGYLEKAGGLAETLMPALKIFRLLREQIKGVGGDVSGIQSDTEKAMSGFFDALHGGMTDAEKAALGFFDVMYEGTQDIVDGVKDVNDAIDELIYNWRDDLPDVWASSEAAIIDNLVKEIDAITTASEKKIKAAEAFSEEVKRLRLGDYEYELQLLEERIRKYEEAGYSQIDIDIVVAEERRRLQEKYASETDKLWQHTLNNIQDEFADTFYRMFDEGLDSWGDFFDSVWDMFKKLLAQIAAQNITKAILGGDGGGGLLGGIAKMFTGEGGGGGILGGIAKIFTGGSGGGGGGGFGSGILGKVISSAAGFFKDIFSGKSMGEAFTNILPGEWSWGNFGKMFGGEAGESIMNALSKGISNLFSGGSGGSGYIVADPYAYQPAGDTATGAATGTATGTAAGGGIVIPEASGMSGLGSGGISGGSTGGTAAGATMMTYVSGIVSAAAMLYRIFSARSKWSEKKSMGTVFSLTPSEDGLFNIAGSGSVESGDVSNAELTKFHEDTTATVEMTLDWFNLMISKFEEGDADKIKYKMDQVLQGYHILSAGWSEYKGLSWNLGLSGEGKGAYQNWLDKVKTTYEEQQEIINEPGLIYGGGATGGSIGTEFTGQYGWLDPTDPGANIYSGADTDWSGVIQGAGGYENFRYESGDYVGETIPLTAGASPRQDAGRRGTPFDVIKEYLGEDFARPFIDSLREEIMAADIWSILTDELQTAALKGLDVQSFMNTPFTQWWENFNNSMEENGAALQKAAQAWFEFNMLIGDAETVALAEANAFTAMDLALIATAEQFEEYLVTLGEAGIDVTKITNLEELRAQALKKTADELREATFAEIDAGIDSLVGTVTAAEQQLDAIVTTTDDWKAALEQLKISGEENIEVTQKLAEVEAVQAQALSELTDNYNNAREEIALSVMGLVGGISPLQEQVMSIDNQFDEWTETLRQLSDAQGLVADSTADLAALEEYRSVVLSQLITKEEQAIEAELDTKIMAKLKPTQLAIIQVADEFSATIQRVKELAAVSGQTYDHLIAKAKQWQLMQIEDMILAKEKEIEGLMGQIGGGAGGGSSATNTLSGAISELSSVISGLAGVIQSLDDQILGMQISSVNPASALERFNIIQAKIAGAGTPTTPEEIADLQSLYTEMLSLGGEIWQRPSPEYQGVYDEVLAALMELRNQADDIKTDYEIQLEQLEAQQSTASYITGTGQRYDQEALSLAQQQLEELKTQKMLLEVDWIGMTGDTEGLMDLLSKAVDVFGWDSPITLDFVADMGMNFQGASPQDYIDILDFVQESSGGYASEASLTLLAEYIGRGLPLDTVMTFLGAQGVDEATLIEIEGRLNVAMASNQNISVLNANLGDLATTMQSLSADIGGTTYGFTMGQALAEIIIQTKRSADNLSAINAANNLTSYGYGGISYGPEVAMVGERGPEAHIPLDNMKIPVKLLDGGSMRPISNSKINIDIVVNESSTPHATGTAVSKSVLAALRDRIVRKEVLEISQGG